MADNKNTQYFKVNNETDIAVKDILEAVYIALTEKGYNPVNQIVGYIVLIEEETEIDGTKYMTGHSKNYIRCAFEMDGLVPNMVIKGTINSTLNEEFGFCKRID